jgi:hypothetical protein
MFHGFRDGDKALVEILEPPYRGSLDKAHLVRHKVRRPLGML